MAVRLRGSSGPIPPLKADRKAALRRLLENAQRALAVDHAWATGHKPPGDKVDALALDTRGRILVVEVKPGSQRSTVVWTPVPQTGEC